LTLATLPRQWSPLEARTDDDRKSERRQLRLLFRSQVVETPRSRSGLNGVESRSGITATSYACLPRI